MTMWSPVIQRDGNPLYKAIADDLARDIEAGRISHGDRLPTQRQLASSLGVALTTVTRAYAEAERRRLVSGEVGRGTFVRATRRPSEPESSAANGLIDLRTNALLPFPHAPRLVERVAEVVLGANPFRLLDYEPLIPPIRHREAGARWARNAGLDVPPDQVLLTSGAQHAMLVAFSTICHPGDVVLTEEFTYGGMKSLANLLHLRIRGLAMDEHGLRPDAFAAACREGEGRAIFLMPTLHNPTTATMPPERREEIAAIALEHGMPIVEDDSYGFLLPELRPMATYAPSLTYYLASASKSIASGLRIAFLIPPPNMVDRLAAAIWSTTYTVSPAMAEVVTEWIGDGQAEEIMAWKREESRARQAMAIDILGPYGYRGHRAAHHGWLSLPEPWCTSDFVAQAKMRGVLISPAEDFVAGRATAPHAVRVSLGPASDREVLGRGLNILAEILAAPPEPCRPVM